MIEKEQFEKSYAERSGMTVEQMHEMGLHAEKCEDCDYIGCKGWQMAS